ncbi:hypothetical protein K2X33_07255 [bacterium]|nr:hypothetical protein [bacterium]
MNWETKGKVLLLNGAPVPLAGDVRQVLEHNGALIVVLEYVKGAPLGSRNVVGVNSSGKCIWQIAALENLAKDPNPVTCVENRDNKIYLFFWEGVYGLLDTRDGSYIVPDGQRPW